jgi:hypothetical protein
VTSVVAKMNFTCGGGSSSVFKNAFHAFCESMCTSSTMKILKRSRCGRYGELLLQIADVVDARAARGVDLLDVDVDAGGDLDLHAGHSRHGVLVGPFSQLSALARMRALVVLPTPRTPVNKNACATRSIAIALPSVVATCS